ncbi:ribose-phosphate diphosphokinase [Frateuria defendens]|uniref:ribose-phosphate diphosphokinase n=1 Tax=Frateuria defendens TaxID=2219559 RepID=UPI00066FCAD1|nr:ribose-phosphate diphosphokinase [Frateuria defendens]
MNRVLYALPGNEDFTGRLARHAGLPVRALDLHRFPDGESLVRLEPPPPGEEAVLVCTLDRPDPKLWPLLAAADTLRELGAARVGLVAPYLAYMRQDARFHAGEAVSSRIFGRLLGQTFDWLLTVDPHLHRHRSLADAGLPQGEVIHAAPRLAEWVRANVRQPLIVGPDGESEQWACQVAVLAGAPALIASKQRDGDRAVRVHLPALHTWRSRTPVLLDDLIASGHTMLETVGQLRAAGLPPPLCVAVHGVFADDALAALRRAGVADVVTSNTIPGPAAAIDLSADIAAALPVLRTRRSAG